MLAVGSVIQLSERKTLFRANAPLTLNGRNHEDSERKVKWLKLKS